MAAGMAAPRRDVRKRDDGGDHLLAAALVPEVEERVWQPTRSVLQQGARETGVKVGAHQPGQGLR